MTARRSLHDRRDSARSLLIAAAVHGALAWALLTGLGVTPVPRALQEPLAVINLRDEPPPPPPTVMLPEKAPKKTHKPKDPEGAAAPPNVRNTPTPVVAPKPVVVLPPPLPLPAAPVAGQGTAGAAGAAPVPGPGTGRGGVGNGLGSGLSGNGSGGGGGGGGGGEEDGPEFLGGKISLSDLPPGLRAQHPRGSVYFRLRVSRTGQLTDCRIARSSGSPTLDAATCQAALRRLRFGPALDRAGRPIDQWTEANEHEWIDRGPPPGRADDDGPDDD